MVKIIWSPLARANLKKIIDYIALDSPVHAKKFLKQVLNKVRTLKKLPNLGRNVPELPFSDEREIFHKNYRIIYEYIEEIVGIITIIHSKQDFFRAFASAR